MTTEVDPSGTGFSYATLNDRVCELGVQVTAITNTEQRRTVAEAISALNEAVAPLVLTYLAEHPEADPRSTRPQALMSGPDSRG